MKKHPGKIIPIVICLCLIFVDGMAQTTQRSLLLVCSADSSLSSLSITDARKIFLGIPTVLDNVRLVPLLNTSDTLLAEVFLQKIIFMSRRDYEQQLLSRVFRLGGKRPSEYENISELTDVLLNTPGSISFMWSDQVADHKDLKSLRVVWSNSNN